MKLSAKMNDIMKRAILLYSKEEVEQALQKMAHEMSAKLYDKDPVFLCILLGGIVPLGNLLPLLDFQMEINYIHLSSYAGKTSAGELHWKAEPTISLKDRTVVVIDDILDTGLTLRAAIDYCLSHGAKETYTAVLLDKRKPRKEGGVKEADFRAIAIEDKFVFGYGLDYNEYLRNVPGIYAVAAEDQ
jgi:hypoxanthine phosphoribosyltransferase